jgi:methyl-accepting chemotaxis protein
MSENKPPEIFVVAAQVAAELYFAMKEARSLSLTAKNARVIAVRAGSQASGFNAITDFIETLSTSTIQQAQLINQVAIKVSKLAVELQRRSDLLSKLQLVHKKSPKAAFLQTTNRPLQDTKVSFTELNQQFSNALKQLYEAILEAQKQIRSAKVIATSSKVEANQAGDFEGALMVIADNIEVISDTIKKHLHQAKLQLDMHTSITHQL